MNQKRKKELHEISGNIQKIIAYLNYVKKEQKEYRDLVLPYDNELYGEAAKACNDLQSAFDSLRGALYSIVEAIK